MRSPKTRLAGRAMLAVLALGLSRSAAADEFNLGQLLAALAGGRHGAATFTETKYLGILEQPVESSGELLFVPPSRLEKRTVRPRAETLVLDGDVLTVERPPQTRVLPLKQYPEVGAVVESIRATLAGDREALERVYRLDLDGGRDRWTLVLTPRDAGVARAISQIRLDGARDEVRRVEILQADGDRSVMDVRRGVAR
jgi:outer membrane lipoprotein-sorting protein